MVQKSLGHTGAILNVKLQATCTTLYIFMLRVITKTLSQDTRCSGRYSNWVPPTYRSEALDIAHCLVSFGRVWLTV
jgi:hypothetical protein